MIKVMPLDPFDIRSSVLSHVIARHFGAEAISVDCHASLAMTKFAHLAIFCYNTYNMVSYILPIEIQPLEEGGYLARSPDLPGFLVQADTVEELVGLAPGVAQTLIEAMQEKGIPLPETLHTAEPPFHTDLLVPV